MINMKFMILSVTRCPKTIANDLILRIVLAVLLMWSQGSAGSFYGYDQGVDTDDKCSIPMWLSVIHSFTLVTVQCGPHDCNGNNFDCQFFLMADPY